MGKPSRKLAESVPRIPLPQQLVLDDSPLPIDDSDGDCDTPGDKEHRAYCCLIE
jgi:hypothetical protein